MPIKLPFNRGSRERVNAMNATEKKQFAQVMMGIGVMYHTSITEPLLELYWENLKRFELSRVVAAINTHINHPESGQYLPKIANLVRILEGSYHTKALQAWHKVITAIQSKGCYSTVVFDDAIIHQVVM